MSIDSFLTQLLKERAASCLSNSTSDSTDNTYGCTKTSQHEQVACADNSDNNDDNMTIVIIPDNAKLEGHRSIVYSLPPTSATTQEAKRSGRWLNEISPHRKTLSVVIESPLSNHTSGKRSLPSPSIVTPPKSLSAPLTQPKRRRSMQHMSSKALNDPRRTNSLPSTPHPSHTTSNNDSHNGHNYSHKTPVHLTLPANIPPPPPRRRTVSDPLRQSHHESRWSRSEMTGDCIDSDNFARRSSRSTIDLSSLEDSSISSSQLTRSGRGRTRGTGNTATTSTAATTMRKGHHSGRDQLQIPKRQPSQSPILLSQRKRLQEDKDVWSIDD